MNESYEDTTEPTVGQQLAKVSRLVGCRLRSKLRTIDLSHAQSMILFHLWREDGTAQNIIAKSLNITPATVTNTLQRMERDGWITRRRSATDQRVIQVFLTKKARSLKDELHGTFRDLDLELVEVLTKEEQSALSASLGKIYHHLLQAVPDHCRGGLLHDCGEENR